MNEEQQGPSVIVECQLDAPPEQVFRALTEPALLASWLMPNDFEAEVGATFTFRPEGEPPIHCEVLALEPGRLVRYSWRESPPREAPHLLPLDAVVTFELTPAVSGGTHLRLVHSGLAPRVGRVLPFSARASASATGALTYGSLRCAA